MGDAISMFAGILPLLLGGAYALQPPGQFHASEPVALDGERWLALRMTGRDAALLPTRVRVRRVFDGLVDEPGGATGQDVTSPLGDHVMVFLRGAALVAGVVDTARVTGASTPDRVDYSAVFRDMRFRIASHCASPQPDATRTRRRFNCRLILQRGDGREQSLAHFDGFADAGATVPSFGNDAAPTLLFAGDLDRDGELDLLLDMSNHYNISRPTLFLSSQAGPGEFLRQVAQHESTGC